MSRRIHHLAFILGALGVPRLARADLRLHIDGFGALPVGGWQARAFGPGGGASAGVELSLGARVGLLATAGYTAVTPAHGALDQGVAQPGAGGFGSFSAGLRVRPLGRVGTHGEGLWFDVQGGAALTGGAARPVLLARAGFGFSSGAVSFGPWVGTAMVLQTDSQNLPNDAHFLLAGVEASLLGASQPALPPLRPRTVAPVHRCLQAAAHTVPDVDGDGCPEDDTDGDGIPDRVDHCPNEPEDRDGFQDSDGCPDPDNDRDGIPDVRDLCPNEPEVVNGVDDTDGCPDAAAVRVDDGHVVLEDRIQFQYDSARIETGSLPVVRALVQLLVSHPEFARLSIEGHADDRGGDHYNDQLSYHRARAVADMLIDAGLPRDRVEALGFGRRIPLAAGTDEGSRVLNRRVEFYVDGHRSRGLALTTRGYATVSPQGALTPADAP